MQMKDVCLMKAILFFPQCVFKSSTWNLSGSLYFPCTNEKSLENACDNKIFFVESCI